MEDAKLSGWKTLTALEIITLGLGGLTGWLTSRDQTFYESLQKPFFAPPGWLFPIAWALLYFTMALSIWLVIRKVRSERKSLLTLYFVQLAVNLIWPVIFFVIQALGLAFVWLLLLAGLTVWMMLRFYPHSKAAFWLLVPYLLWIGFAGVLNFLLARMN